MFVPYKLADKSGIYAYLPVHIIMYVKTSMQEHIWQTTPFSGGDRTVSQSKKQTYVVPVSVWVANKRC